MTPYHITFISPDGTAKQVEAPENWSLMQIAKHNNIPTITARCGGSMVCTTCHAIIKPNDWDKVQNSQDNEQSEEEHDILEAAPHVTKTSRLLCQIIMTESLDGITIRIP